VRGPLAGHWWSWVSWLQGMMVDVVLEVVFVGEEVAISAFEQGRRPA